MGIGLIRPTVGSLQVADNTRRFLVITRHLNPQILRELGDTFQIDDLSLTSEQVNDMSVPLKSASGEVLGYLSWKPRLPGAAAAKAASLDITPHCTVHPGADFAVHSFQLRRAV
ncbi:Uncharacterised protein [Leclercia adecarboxylata]|uniref:Uncharacterized protein n=1 Tax=Leclercia adecarboxylata TaxID=83655 RepID=A0A4U9HT01_9ENTR|nr:Uncharacterised protein [Leclercia adecarboxylata]